MSSSEQQDFLDQMGQLVAFMRERGIYKVKNGDFEMEIVLTFVPPVANQPEPEAKSEPVKEPKRGKDGLTAEDQEALYGRVMSDTKE
jgi:hypothetical protein